MFRCERRKYCSDPPVNMCKKEEQRESHADQKYRTLDKVRPEHGFQTAGIGVDDRDHAHDQYQQVHMDPRQASQNHTWQIHDDRHTSDLIDDKHHRAKHAKPLAPESQFQVMVCRVYIKPTVDRQEEPDRQRDRQKHTKLCKPHDPCSRVGISRERQK